MVFVPLSLSVTERLELSPACGLFSARNMGQETKPRLGQLTDGPEKCGAIWCLHVGAGMASSCAEQSHWVCQAHTLETPLVSDPVGHPHSRRQSQFLLMLTGAAIDWRRIKRVPFLIRVQSKQANKHSSSKIGKKKKEKKKSLFLNGRRVWRIATPGYSSLNFINLDNLPMPSSFYPRICTFWEKASSQGKETKWAM